MNEIVVEVITLTSTPEEKLRSVFWLFAHCTRVPERYQLHHMIVLEVLYRTVSLSSFALSSTER